MKEEFKSARKQLLSEIMDAVVFLRTKNQTIPSDTIEFIKIAALEKLNKSYEDKRGQGICDADIYDDFGGLK